MVRDKGCWWRLFLNTCGIWHQFRRGNVHEKYICIRLIIKDTVASMVLSGQKTGNIAGTSLFINSALD